MTRTPDRAAWARRLTVLATAIVFAVLSVTALPATAAPRKRSPTCRQPGDTVYRKGRIRVFAVVVPARGDFGEHDVYYLCSARLRRPRRFLTTDPQTDYRLIEFRRFANRLGFMIDVIGGDTESVSVMWVDVISGRWKSTDPDAELLKGFPSGYAVAADGSIAVLLNANDGGQEIAYARAKPKGLASPRVFATIPSADPALESSLAVVDGSVTWTAKSGAHGSAPIPPGP